MMQLTKQYIDGDIVVLSNNSTFGIQTNNKRDGQATCKNNMVSVKFGKPDGPKFHLR